MPINNTSLVVMLILFIAFTYSTAESANWALIERGDKRDLHLDMASIKKVSKGKVRYWTIITDPYKSPSLGGYKDYMEMDCNKKRTRSVKLETEDQEVNNGYVTVHSSTPIMWGAIEPDSSEELIYEKLCWKRK